MESLALNLQSKNQIIAHRDQSCHVKYEYGIIAELLFAIEQNDLESLTWFGNFGDSLRAITMNVYAYRKGLVFGFTDIAFNQHGWFESHKFLETEELCFGDTTRYGNHSVIHLGRGPNHIWTYSLSYNFGCAGGSCGLSVYGKPFKTRENTLSYALTELKNKMLEKMGDKDTTNYKQPIILATIRDIVKAQVNMVQMTLF